MKRFLQVFTFAGVLTLLLVFQNCGQSQWELKPVGDGNADLASIDDGHTAVCGLGIYDSSFQLRTTFTVDEAFSLNVSTMPEGQPVRLTVVDESTNALIKDFGEISTPQTVSFPISSYQLTTGQMIKIEGAIARSAEDKIYCKQLVKIGTPGSPGPLPEPGGPGTNPQIPPPSSAPTSVEIAAQQPLYNGQAIRLQKISMVMQGDGNLVIYDSGGKALWSIMKANMGEYCTTKCFAVFKNDGNFVTYNESKTGDLSFYWTTATGFNIPSKMTFQQTEPYLKIVRKDNGSVLWSSASPQPPPQQPPSTTTTVPAITTTTTTTLPAPAPTTTMPAPTTTTTIPAPTTTTTIPTAPTTTTMPAPAQKRLVVCKKTIPVPGLMFPAVPACQTSIDTNFCPLKAGYTRKSRPACILLPPPPGGNMSPQVRVQGTCLYERATCTSEPPVCESGFTLSDGGPC